MLENDDPVPSRLCVLQALALIALIGAATFVPAFQKWPLLWVVPLTAYAVLVAIVPQWRERFRPWRFGQVSWLTIAATVAVAAGSCTVLVAFHFYIRPDVRVYGSFLPVTALGGVLAAGILFSIFNALFEEVIFRGVLFDAVQSQWGDWVAVGATAFLFGYGHMRGYPPGPLGAVLAAVYGICLGSLRVLSGGIGLGFVAHIAADATIFILVARSGAF